MKKNWGANLILLIIFLYLAIPIIATFLFSIADKWDSTVLPQTYSFKWYKVMLTNQDVLLAIGRSFLVSGATVVVGLATILPATFITYIYMPNLKSMMNVMAVLPFALPGIILAVGLIQIYSGGPLPIAGTFWILLFSYIVTCLPYIFNSLVNNLEAIHAKVLIEAAQSIGASKLVAFVKIIIPNIRSGIISAGLLTFSVSLGEFVLANLLVGGRFATLQIMLEKAMHIDGHLSSAMVMLYFVLVAAASLLMIWVTQSAAGRSSQIAGRT